MKSAISTSGYARRSRLVCAKNPLPQMPSYLLNMTLGVGVLFCSTAGLSAGVTTVLSNQAQLPEIGFSLLRVVGALSLVLALFLGGVWLYRNWQRLVIQKGKAPKLSILEVKPLGQRHGLYLVGYEQQRFLLASSPTGITLVTHLPDSETFTEEPVSPVPTPFNRAFQKLLSRAASLERAVNGKTVRHARQ
jgi:flagellar biogenesis protein FliO